jgi:rifampin ADP-ribosylating transferase
MIPNGHSSRDQAFFHGTRDPLDAGQLIHARHTGDGGPDDQRARVYFSRSLDDAIWAAEVSPGDGLGRVYRVEPTGPAEEPVISAASGGPGHPSMSCWSHEPLLVTGEVTEWPLYHGTRADLRVGDLIEPGRLSNFGKAPRTSNHVYFTRTLNAATWGAELARGEGRARIYLVEATGPFEDDPNLTNKKFRGNPTKAFRSRSPLRVTGELTEWVGHAPEAVEAMKEALARMQQLGTDVVDD